MTTPAMSAADPMVSVHNGQAVAREALGELSLENFQRLLLEGVDEGQRVAALFGAPGDGADKLDVYMVLADDRQVPPREPKDGAIEADVLSACQLAMEPGSGAAVFFKNRI